MPNDIFIHYSSIMNIESPVYLYDVPKFQRSYSWKVSNCESLLDDIETNESGHYMGSLICVPIGNVRPDLELIYEIVDGQQRLTTISLLLLAIYYQYSKIAGSSKTNNPIIFNKLSNLQKKLFKYTNNQSHFKTIEYLDVVKNCVLRVIPSSQEKNYEDYLYLFKKVGIASNDLVPQPYWTRRNIFKAFDYFTNKIINYDFGQLDILLEKINNLRFVFISANDHNEAYLMFETINDRGVQLTAMDIIKNKLLMTLERNQIDINIAFTKWKELIDNLSESSNHDRFLRHYYNAFKINSEIKLAKFPLATSTKLIEIYLELIQKFDGKVDPLNKKNQIEYFFEDLLSKSKIYKQYVDPTDKVKDKSDVINNVLFDLENIGAVTCYTSLLYLFSLKEEDFEYQYLKDDDLKISKKDYSIYRVLEFYRNYYVRRNITDFPGTRDLDSIQIDLIQKCDEILKEKKKLTSKMIIDIIMIGKGKPASIKEFRDILLNSMYDSNVGMTRFVLSFLNETFDSNENLQPNLWLRNTKKKLIWTIEHVFPEGDNIPEEWIKMIGNGNKELAKEYQAEHVHRLGNLTLSGYNSKLSNKSFNDKKTNIVETILGVPIHVGYQNGLALNNIEYEIKNKPFTLATAEELTVEHIEARTKVIVDHLLKLFAFEGENLD